jgi:hypothetical protein
MGRFREALAAAALKETAVRDENLWFAVLARGTG